jgi:hypothetical protein
MLSWSKRIWSIAPNTFTLLNRSNLFLTLLTLIRIGANKITKQFQMFRLKPLSRQKKSHQLMPTNLSISHRLKLIAAWCLKSLDSWSKSSYSLIKPHQKQVFKQICLNTSWLVTMFLDFKFLSREITVSLRLLLATELSISIILCQSKEEPGTLLICLYKRLWPSPLSWLSNLQ